MPDLSPHTSTVTRSHDATAATGLVTVILVLAGDTAENSIELLREWMPDQAAAAAIDLELTVVLAGSSKGHEDAVHAFVEQMGTGRPRHVLKAESASFPAGIRAALDPRNASCHGEWCVLWPGSARPERGWIEHLAEQLCADAPRLVQPLVVQRDGTIASAGGVPRSDGPPDPFLRGLPVEDAVRRAELHTSIPMGPIVAVRTADLQLAHGLDERYVGGLAEIDLAARLGDPVAVRIVQSARVLGRGQGRYGFTGHRAVSAEALVRDHGTWLRSRPAPQSTTASQTGSAQVPTWPRLRWAIDTAVPGDERRFNWGDWLFAQSLARALERLGQDVAVDTKASRNRPSRQWDDVVLVLRGLDRRPRVDGAVNLLWVISHPDDVTAEEVGDFDCTLAASTTWSPSNSIEPGREVRPLLQCTDPGIFAPTAAREGDGHHLVFVGNSRSVQRDMITSAIEAGLAPAIYGRGWEGLVDPSIVVQDFADPEQVATLYASSDLVLADHWPDMRTKGFVSNRVFDVLAAAGAVVTDDVVGLESLGLTGLVTIREPQDWERVRSTARDELFGTREARLQQAERIARDHSFDARAEVLLEAALEHQATTRRSEQLEKPSRRDRPSKRLRLPAIRSLPSKPIRARQIWDGSGMNSRQGGAVIVAAMIVSTILLQVVTGRWELSGLLAIGWLMLLTLGLLVRQNRSVHRQLRSQRRQVRALNRLLPGLVELVEVVARRQRAAAVTSVGLPGQLSATERQLAEDNRELSAQVASLATQVHDLAGLAQRQSISSASASDRLEARLQALRDDVHTSLSDSSTSAARARPRDTSAVVGEDLLTQLVPGSGQARVNLVLDSFTPKQIFAGVRTALLAGTEAALRLGLPLRLLVLREPEGDLDVAREELSGWILAETLDRELANTVELTTHSRRNASVHADDLWIATYWATAAALQHACSRGVTSPAHVLYLVQDWEPGFFAWGTQHSLAFDTYDAGFHLVVNSSPLARFLEAQTGLALPPNSVFAPQLDVERLHHAAIGWTPADPARPRLLYYARPSKPRNLYALGLDAMRAWGDQLPADIHPVVTLAGEDIGPIDLGDRLEVVRAGKRDIDEYFELLSRTDIGLALMHSPHPSHLPLELPMAGIPTVTNALGNHRRPWVEGLRVAPTRASAIAHALDDCFCDAQNLREHTPRPAPSDLGVSLRDAVRSAVDAMGAAW